MTQGKLTTFDVKKVSHQTLSHDYQQSSHISVDFVTAVSQSGVLRTQQNSLYDDLFFSTAQW